MADLLGTQLTATATPLEEGSARGTQSLDSAQRAAKIGDLVPIVFGKRVGTSGGVLVSPPATECQFSTFTAFVSGISTLHVQARYQLVLSEGVINRPQVRDVFQQSCRVGSSSTAYNTRAGTWVAGNTLPSSIDAPRFCGTGGTYENLTMLSFSNGIPAQFDQWRKQVHCFVRGGLHVKRLLDGVTGSSNVYPDLALYLIRKSSRITDATIDIASFTAAARFVSANNFNCDCLIDQTENLSDWLQETAPIFLLRRSRINGKEALRPLVPINQDGSINTGFIRWVHTFDNAQIAELNVNYTSLTDRNPFAALAMWRQQPDDDLGLIRTTEVRYAGTASEGPFEQHDFTKYVTNENHAVKVAAYILSRRRHIEHMLTLTTTPNAFNGTLSIGDIVRVKYQSTDNTGATLNHDYLYEVDKINKSLIGTIEFELIHFPIDNEGRSLVALDVSRAAGSSKLMPTGREAVSCDINSPTNENPWPIIPTPDWEPEFDIELDVPIGVEEWIFDDEEDEWETEDGLTEEDIIDELDPDTLFPDETDYEPDEEKLEEGEGTPYWWVDTATASLDKLELRYLQNDFYGWREADYAILYGKLVINQPLLTSLAIDFSFNNEEFRVVIPKSSISPFGLPEVGPYQNWFAFSTNILTPFFCEAKAVVAIRSIGGDFKEVIFPETKVFNVCPYVANITGSASIESLDPEDESGPLVVRGEFAVDQLPVGSSLEIVLALGSPLYTWDSENKSWVWTGSTARPKEPTVYTISIGGILSRFTESGWEWDVFAKEWVYRYLDANWEWSGANWNYIGKPKDDFTWDSEAGEWTFTGEGSPGQFPSLQPPTSTLPPSPIAEPLPTTFEVAVPSTYDEAREELRIVYAAQGGFSSHVLPELGSGLGAFMIVTASAAIGGDSFDFVLDGTPLNGTAATLGSNYFIYHWNLSSAQLQAVRDEFDGYSDPLVLLPDPLSFASDFQQSGAVPPPYVDVDLEMISVQGTIFTSDTTFFTGYIGSFGIVTRHDRAVWDSNAGGTFGIFWPSLD